MSELKTVKEHLQDLKKTLLRILIVAVALFFTTFIFSEKIILFLINYFNLNLYVLSPLEFIRTQMIVSLYLTIALLLPFTLVQIFLFSKSALQKQTIKKSISYFIHSINLAIAGFLFGVFIFSKFGLSFFSALPQEVSAMWGVYSAIMFIIMSGFAFALTAQIIIIIPLLVKLELVEINAFKKSRKLVILASLLISAIVTSPDPITQILMGVPMYICFETGIIISTIQQKRQKTKEFKKTKK
jgi:sec-independent protein translocase protein TatC